MRQHCSRVLSFFVRLPIWALLIALYIFWEGEQLLHEAVWTHCKIALNSWLLCPFAIKFDSNESWIISEWAYLSEFREEIISRQHFSSLFAVFIGFCFRHSRGQLQRHRRVRFTCYQVRNFASPSLPKMLRATNLARRKVLYFNRDWRKHLGGWDENRVGNDKTFLVQICQAVFCLSITRNVT